MKRRPRLKKGAQLALYTQNSDSGGLWDTAVGGAFPPLGIELRDWVPDVL